MTIVLNAFTFSSFLVTSKKTVITKLTEILSNFNYILFTKLPRPGDSVLVFEVPPVYHMRWRLHTVPLIAERQAGKL